MYYLLIRTIDNITYYKIVTENTIGSWWTTIESAIYSFEKYPSYRVLSSLETTISEFQYIELESLDTNYIMNIYPELFI